MKLRSYQQEAADRIITELKKNTLPIMISAATGCGKSVILAELARWFWQKTGKKVLCIAPRAELVKQNAEKYQNYGFKASFFSGSTGFPKETDNAVVFGTPVTVFNSWEKFKNFGLILIDECDSITRTIKKTVKNIQQSNPNIRIVGMTGTPYRTKEGYIFKHNQYGQPVSNAVDPFFDKCVFEIKTEKLIDMGYLTPMVIGKTGSAYNTEGLELKKNGQFTEESNQRVFEGKGRLTSLIVKEVVLLAENCKRVIFFAATIEHAKEIRASLPDAKLITGKTPGKERKQILDDFKEGKFKYIINVIILSVGFDCPETDCIALLRATIWLNPNSKNWNVFNKRAGFESLVDVRHFITHVRAMKASKKKPKFITLVKNDAGYFEIVDIEFGLKPIKSERQKHN